MTKAINLAMPIWKQALKLLIGVCIGLILFELGAQMGLDSELAILGPAVGLGAAIYLTYGKRAIMGLLVVAASIQILMNVKQIQTGDLAGIYRFCILIIFFMLLSILIAKASARIRAFYFDSNVKSTLATFGASVLFSMIGVSLAFFSLNLFAKFSNADTAALIGIAALGQYIGLVVSLPLVEGLFTGNAESQKRELRNVAFPLWLLFAIAIIFFGFLNGEIERRSKAEFEKISIEIGGIIESQLNAQEVFIEGVAAFFYTRIKPVTDGSFEKYVAHGLIRYPMVQGISWLSYLKPDQLSQFTREQQKTYPGYEIKLIGGDTNKISDSNKTFYTPVTFIEPLKANKKALGFDISSNPARLDTINKAILSKQVVATPPIKLVQEQKNSAGILLMKFIPESKNGPGLVSEVLRLEDFIGQSTAKLSKDANIRVIDVDAKSVIFEHQYEETGFNVSDSIKFGGRVYQISTSPSELFLRSHNPLKYKFFMAGLTAFLLSIFYSFLVLISNFQKSISEKVNEQTKLLLKNEQQLKYVLDATGDGIWDWNILTGHVSHNQRWLEILGLHTSDTTSSLDGFKNRIYPEDLPRVLEALNTSLENNKKYSLEYRMIRGDQSLTWVSDVGMVVERSSNGDPMRMVGAIADISYQKESQSKIEELVFFDPVTNLPNRRYVKDRIERSIHEAARVDSFSGLMLLDLDNFKLVNDTHGHNIGDVLLQKFGTRLIEILRPMDVVARIGGDEFLVLFERNHASEEECRVVLETVLERLCTELEEPFDLGGSIRVTITPSIGVVIYSQKSKGFDEVLKFADLAMYKNKINASEKYRFFDQSLHDEFLETSEMAGGLIKACEADQFYVEYQPVLDRNKEVVAFEALARWDHPDLGTVMPGKFIPFAENNGQIRLVSNTIFKKIFSSPQVAQLKEGKKPIRLMINLSGAHLIDIEFADKFTTMVKSYDFPLNLIDLEVTEGVFLEDKQRPIQVMQVLNELGVKFALDDFGTGYSSFSYLQKLPIQFLKIDKSFVDDLISVSTGGSIVENIIALAHTLNLKVVAEGVETEEQFNILLALGCDYFQGWYCGRPGPLPSLQG